MSENFTYHRVLQVRAVPGKIAVDHIQARGGLSVGGAGAAHGLRVLSDGATEVGVGEGELLELVAVERVVDGLAAGRGVDGDGLPGRRGGELGIAGPVPVGSAKGFGSSNILGLVGSGVLLSNGLGVADEDLLVERKERSVPCREEDLLLGEMSVCVAAQEQWKRGFVRCVGSNLKQHLQQRCLRHSKRRKADRGHRRLGSRISRHSPGQPGKQPGPGCRDPCVCCQYQLLLQKAMKQLSPSSALVRYIPCWAIGPLQTIDPWP